MTEEQKQLAIRRLKSIAATANDAQRYVMDEVDLEEFGHRIESIQEDLADILQAFDGAD